MQVDSPPSSSSSSSLVAIDESRVDAIVLIGQHEATTTLKNRKRGHPLRAPTSLHDGHDNSTHRSQRTRLLDSSSSHFLAQQAAATARSIWALTSDTPEISSGRRLSRKQADRIKHATAAWRASTSTANDRCSKGKLARASLASSSGGPSTSSSAHAAAAAATRNKRGGLDALLPRNTTFGNMTTQIGIGSAAGSGHAPAGSSSNGNGNGGPPDTPSALPPRNTSSTTNARSHGAGGAGKRGSSATAASYAARAEKRAATMAAKKLAAQQALERAPSSGRLAAAAAAAAVVVGGAGVRPTRSGSRSRTTSPMPPSRGDPTLHSLQDNPSPVKSSGKGGGPLHSRIAQLAAADPADEGGATGSIGDATEEEEGADSGDEEDDEEEEEEEDEDEYKPRKRYPVKSQQQSAAGSGSSRPTSPAPAVYNNNSNTISKGMQRTKSSTNLKVPGTETTDQEDSEMSDASAATGGGSKSRGRGRKRAAFTGSTPLDNSQLSNEPTPSTSSMAVDPVAQPAIPSLTPEGSNTTAKPFPPPQNLALAAITAKSNLPKLHSPLSQSFFSSSNPGDPKSDSSPTRVVEASSASASGATPSASS